MPKDDGVLPNINVTKLAEGLSPVKEGEISS